MFDRLDNLGFFGARYLDVHSILFSDAQTAQDVEFIRRILDLNTDKTILDLCCGYARHTNVLADHCSVVGLDIDATLLNHGRGQYSGDRPPYLTRGDMGQLPFANEVFDAVIMMQNSFGYLQDNDSDVLSELSRVVKTGGTVILELLPRDAMRYLVPPQQIWREFSEGGYVLSRIDFDPSSGIHVDDEITIYPDGARSTTTFTQRLYSFTEIADMARHYDIDITVGYQDNAMNKYRVVSPMLFAIGTKL